MATRSNIGMINRDGTVTAIYCHWDGYPDNQMPLLTGNYNTPEKVEELLSLGNLSYLAENLGEKHDFGNNVEGWCMAYGRDRGESNQDAKVYPSKDSHLLYENDYTYLFTQNGEWVCKKN